MFVMGFESGFRAIMEGSKIQIKIQTDTSETVIVKNGLRQGDSISCLLFNLASGKVVREAGT